MQIRSQLPSGIRPRRLLGGLAPDSDQPMQPEMQRFLKLTWRKITRQVPGTRFNFDFWQHCAPRRSTYPACRAVIAARTLDVESEEPMILAIQQAYYLQARNPSDDETLVELAGEIGLSRSRFAETHHAPHTQVTLEREIELSRAMGASSFPALVLDWAGEYTLLQHDYLDPGPVLQRLNSRSVDPTD